MAETLLTAAETAGMIRVVSAPGPREAVRGADTERFGSRREGFREKEDREMLLKGFVLQI